MVPSGATNYTFSSGSATVSPVTTTTYYVTGDSGGCPSLNAAVSIVTVHPVPSVTVAGPNSMCLGQTVNFTVTGAPSYSWSTGQTTSVIAVSPSITTAYSVSGTSTLGCTGPATIKNIVVNPNPNVLISSGSTVICRGETMLLTGSGADSYQWNTGAMTSTIMISPTVTTTYSVVGTNTTTGCMGNATKTVQVNTCTGIDGSATSLAQFRLYPNPSNGEIHIESPVSAKLMIYNALGEIMLSEELYQGTQTVQTETFSDGVYFARIVYGDQIRIIKLIKEQ
jgi:hypothetical protein